MIVREREAETQAGSMHQEPNVGFDPGSPGSRPRPKAGAKPLRHPGIPISYASGCSCQWGWRLNFSFFSLIVSVWKCH